MFNIFSIIVGALIAIMTSFNGILSTYMGNYSSTVVIHTAGLIAIILVLFIKKYKITYDKSIPIYLYSAGVVGVFTVLFSNYTYVPLGASLTMSLGLLGQSVSAILIDHYGLFGVNVIKFNKKKLIGLSIIIVGLLIMTFY